MQPPLRKQYELGLPPVAPADTFDPRWLAPAAWGACTAKLLPSGLNRELLLQVRESVDTLRPAIEAHGRSVLVV